MKTHLVKKQTIEQYVKGNIQSKSAFSIWLSILKWGQWKEPNDIISTFNSADISVKVQNELFLILAVINIE